jgi:hypothetical protein
MTQSGGPNWSGPHRAFLCKMRLHLEICAHVHIRTLVCTYSMSDYKFYTVWRRSCWTFSFFSSILFFFTFAFIFRPYSLPSQALFLIIHISLLFPTSPQFFSACSSLSIPIPSSCCRLSTILVCSFPSLPRSSSYVSVSLYHSSPLVPILITFFSVCSCLSILFVFLCSCLSIPFFSSCSCLSILCSPLVYVSSFHYFLLLLSLNHILICLVPYLYYVLPCLFLSLHLILTEHICIQFFLSAYPILLHLFL